MCGAGEAERPTRSRRREVVRRRREYREADARSPAEAGTSPRRSVKASEPASNLARNWAPIAQRPRQAILTSVTYELDCSTECKRHPPDPPWAKDAGIRAHRAAFAEAVPSAVPVVPFGLLEARQYAELWAGPVRKGTVLRPHDLIIAATALAHGDTLATLNRKGFTAVGGLQLARLESYLAR
ncbi:MAG TPA: PIN domain-containing protein [Gemmatimonadaceae bacterium]|nr:PIN domain-containing protein [Gemmatimonadaceae bacterium]